MKKNKILLVFLILLLILSTCVLNGCRTQQPQTPAPRANPGDMPNQWSPNPIDQDITHNNVSVIAARNPRVSDAVASVMDDQALVGLYLISEYSKEELQEIKEEVANDVRNSRDDIQRVYVTADEDLVEEIRIVYLELNRGEPIEEYRSSIQNLISVINGE